MRRSLMDFLHMLKTSIGGDEFFAAGVPWFVALFGRDSLTTSLQTMAFWSDTPAPRSSVCSPATRVRRRATGGKSSRARCCYQLRVGEMARMGMVPHSPYYGTIDATPLFLILMSRHARGPATWTSSGSYASPSSGRCTGSTSMEMSLATAMSAI